MKKQREKEMNKKLKKPIALALLLGIVITGLTAIYQWEEATYNSTQRCLYEMVTVPYHGTFTIVTRDEFTGEYSSWLTQEFRGLPFIFLNMQDSNVGKKVIFAPIAFVVNFIIWFIIILFVILVTLVTPIRKIKI